MKRILLSVVYLICSNIFGESGKSGSLEGIVIEKSTKQPLQGANVIIKGTTMGAATDDEGKFTITNISAGIYQISVSMVGYETINNPEVIISQNRVTKLKFELNPVSIELDESVIVSSGYFEIDPEKIISTKKLTSQDIRSSPGSAEDVFRVIHAMPGVTTGSMANSNLIVRGGAPDENLALLDNIEIFSPLHFGRTDASMGSISIINPDLLESVEFSSGAFPAEFGGKLSSLFELKMREGNATTFNTNIDLNMAGFGLYADGPINENSNIVLSARRGIFDLITKMMGRDVMPRFWDAAGKVTYNMAKNNKISLIGFYYEDDVERDKIDESGHFAKGRKYEFLKYDVYGSAIGLNWNYLFSSNGYSLTTASMTSNGWQTNAGTKINKNLNGADLLEQEFTLKNESVLKLNNYVELKGGAFIKSGNTDHLIWTEADTTDTGFIFPADTINYYPPISNKYGGFIQTTLRPVNKLVLTAGLRYDYFDLTDENVLGPRLALSYKLTDNFILNAGYARLSQDPAAYQIQEHELNKNLKSAKADQFVIGLDNILSEDIKISLEAYYKNLTNTFVYSETSKIITNNGSGNIWGIEFFLQKKMIDNLVGSISYTYSISKRKDAEYLQEYYFDYDRTHNFNLVGSYKISNDWQIGIKYSYSTGTPYSPTIGTVPKDGEYYIVKGEKNSARLPDYHELDLRIDKKFEFDGWTLNIYFDIWNVYNRYNIVEYVYDADQKGNVTRKEIYDYKIMPIFGISAQL